jgi:4-diphosphocytidyl-2-C-methyl-D-erythritol kinase
MSPSTSHPRGNARSAPLPGAILESARAKVNLTLHVRGKRPDGYHELESLVVFADVCDELTFEPGAEDGLELEGPFAGLVDGENLVLKAKRTVSSWLGMQISGAFHLRKNIPVAAGLGGGSSDAAAAIRALLRAYGGTRDASPFVARSASIGADVPVCVHNGAAWMCGLGERVTPVAGMPKLPAILVNPRIKLPTPNVFRTLKAPPLPVGAPEAPPALQPLKDVEAVAAYASEGSNDLEAPAIALEPAVDAVLGTIRRLDGCLLARLSGSGPTCFGLFLSQEAAAQAAKAIGEAHPKWWVQATTLG